MTFGLIEWNENENANLNGIYNRMKTGIDQMIYSNFICLVELRISNSITIIMFG